MHYSYQPTGVCSRKIDIDVEDGIIQNITFVRGCNGNAGGINALVKGMRVEDVIEKLSGIQCEARGTSCPDQLAKALIAMRETAR